MEEAWELAVVSEDESRTNTEWSKVHVRLKFEMVIASVLAFFLISGDVKNYKLPFVTIENLYFDDEMVRMIAFLSSLFFLFSFLVRTIFEANRFNDFRFLDLRDIRQIQKKVNSLKGFLDRLVDEKENFSPSLVVRSGGNKKHESLWEFGRATPLMMESSKKIESANNSYKNISQDLRADLEDMIVNTINLNPIGVIQWQKVRMCLDELDREIISFSRVTTGIANTAENRSVKVSANLIAPDFWASEYWFRVRIQYSKLKKSSERLSAKLYSQAVLFFFQRWLLAVIAPLSVTLFLLLLATLTWIGK